MWPSQLLTASRLASTVKKSFVLANLVGEGGNVGASNNDLSIQYLVLDWLGTT